MADECPRNSMYSRKNRLPRSCRPCPVKICQAPLIPCSRYYPPSCLRSLEASVSAQSCKPSYYCGTSCQPPQILRATLCCPSGDSAGGNPDDCCPITICPTLISPISCCPKKCCRPKRYKRYKKYDFMKTYIDRRIYRNGEHLCLSYQGHIPGEQYIHGRNLPTTTTFSKRRLCTYTPYEFVDPDGCCSFNQEKLC